MRAQLGGKAAEAAAWRRMTHPRAIWSLLFPCRDLPPTWGLSSFLPGLNTLSLMTPDFVSQPHLP